MTYDKRNWRMIKVECFKGLVVISICALVTLLAGCTSSTDRLKFLSDYQELTSVDETLKRLEYEPPIKKLSVFEGSQHVDIGYAAFSLPFGEIESITHERSVTISSDRARVGIASPVVYKRDLPITGNGDRKKELAFFTYEGGSMKARDDKYVQYDILLLDLQIEDHYGFERKVFRAKPTSRLVLALMNTKDLFVYEKLLEIKNITLGTWDVTLFETNNVNGVIKQSKEHAGTSIVSIWDKDGRVHQIITIRCSQSLVPQEVEQFVSSFSFAMDRFSTDEDVQMLVTEALKDLKDN